MKNLIEKLEHQLQLIENTKETKGVEALFHGVTKRDAFIAGFEAAIDFIKQREVSDVEK